VESNTEMYPLNHEPVVEQVEERRFSAALRSL